ncbi:MAG: CehA/McbA family metallohydrolase, partial [Abditibacteriales bacterium]|nr:CehA/McbA family metallohydrolase [Abditibacteriales bacterium]
EGKPSPCKVQFIGVAGTPEPDLGPTQRANGCRNLYFSHTGKFTVPLPAGRYYLILSRGPEYNAVYRYLNLNEGQTARVSARLVRVVDSTGWISADFHNHSSESGDNTTETESRITCLVAEGVEFAASTEHNRIQTYRHRLKAMGLERMLATSDGIELTGSPGALNHQNAFPLRLKPHTQDGGAPPTDADVLTQIKRLYEHDDKSEKLVQQNHPDIGWLFFDKDGDGQQDEGFRTFEFTHVIEVWMTNILAMQPTIGTNNNLRNNRIFNWLQLLNQGFRIPGVANTDAHYCFHESGVIRNYVKSSTDDPAKIDEMEVVRQSKKGRIIMTNGPVMEVSFNGALPGDDVRLTNGKGTLRVRVQCANWLDIDRVQVLVNGRLDPRLNFTRTSHPQFFRDGVVKFEQNIPVTLEQDAHLIVVAIGENATIGPIMGHRSETPVAISNPIYVDVDGNGFQPNKDTLGAPLPTKKG